MRKLYFAAATALLLATTSAQAGSGISFQIDGQRVRIESPRGCNSLSCITINAPGYKGKLGNIDLNGFGGSKDKDDDVSPPSGCARCRRTRRSGTVLCCSAPAGAECDCSRARQQ
jgi:hypothetical protein